MKVTGTFKDSAGNEANVTFEFPQIPETDFGDYMPPISDAMRALFQPVVEHLAAVYANIISLKTPIMLVALDMVGEAVTEAYNAALLLEERAQHGEDPRLIYEDYVARCQPEQSGDIVETEDPDAFTSFIEGSLDLDQLDEDEE